MRLAAGERGKRLLEIEGMDSAGDGAFWRNLMGVPHTPKVILLDGYFWVSDNAGPIPICKR